MNRYMIKSKLKRMQPVNIGISFTYLQKRKAFGKWKRGTELGITFQISLFSTDFVYVFCQNTNHAFALNHN